MGQWVIKVGRENGLRVSTVDTVDTFSYYMPESWLLYMSEMPVTLWAKTQNGSPHDSRCDIELQPQRKVSETFVSSCKTLEWVLKRKSSRKKSSRKSSKVLSYICRVCVTHSRTPRE